MFTNKNLHNKGEGITTFVFAVSLHVPLKHWDPGPQSRTMNSHYPKYLLALSSTVLLDNLCRNSCIHAGAREALRE